jgi:3-oxoisoapionate kinase
MKRLITYYGDDFTGSTDVMEALSVHGVDTVLFTRIPTPSEFQAFAQCQAIGLAGISRSQSPLWMREHLPASFAWLRSLDARYCHYKVCSTFDSSPHLGNIGCATEIGMSVFDQKMVPLIVGAPQLKRYTFAAHLFAGYKGEVFRIDRHPVMSRHPVTPMDEPDLRMHLAKQTHVETTLANIGWPDDGVALVDVHDGPTQLAAGQRLLALPQESATFCVGSSGLEYALVKALAATGAIVGTSSFAPLGPVAQTIVVSGSVSPTTERQIKAALQSGFELVSVDAVALAQGRKDKSQTAIDAALRILESGKSPLVCTAQGPSTDQTAALASIPDGRKHIGEALGQILKTVLATTKLRRAIIAGGDSSGHALGQLNVFALTTRMPLPATPGSPLCIAHSTLPDLNGFEIAMKGGQLGDDSYFVQLKEGRP